MKLLLENWREYLKDSKSYKRVVLNELSDITEEELKSFPLSQEELAEVRMWAALKGDPLFLGSGTMGSAYQFGDEVLKVTKDHNEARAAQAIAGKVHPNVYKVKKVARRSGLKGKPPEEFPGHPFLIVYDLVGEEIGGPDLPTRDQQDIIKTIHARPHKIYYHWPGNLDIVKKSFLKWAIKNPRQLEANPISKFKSHELKLDALMSEAGLGEKEQATLKAAWALSAGFYGPKLDSVEALRNSLSRPEFNYVDDIAQGLTFLEQNGIHFRDLKTTNVMNDKGRLVIIDIGKSSVKGQEDIPVIGERDETNI